MQDVVAVSVDELQPGRYQPRLQLRQESLAELAESIREQGVLQPLIVRALPESEPGARTYEIVAGERRWRAAQLAGLAAVPVIVRELSDSDYGRYGVSHGFTCLDAEGNRWTVATYQPAARLAVS